MSPRPYQLGQRKEAVDQNRARIIEAARTLLSADEGVARFTIDAVARQADVARMTVYYQFGSRVGLLEALCDVLADEGGIEQLREVFMVAGPDLMLRRLIEVFCAFWASNRTIMRRLHGMAAIDPEFAEVMDARHARRRKAVTAVVARLNAAESSRGSFSNEEVIDLLAALTGFATYENLASASRTTVDVAGLIYRIAVAAFHVEDRAPSTQISAQ
jgi:AcrR family transcriptional regulator